MLDKMKNVGAVVVCVLIAYLLFSGFHVPDWIKIMGKDTNTSKETPELQAADLRGRLRTAEAYTLEVNSRLEAYKARFESPDAQLLDRVFLDPDGYCSTHPLRKDWYEMRRELTEYLEKHRVFLTLLSGSEIEHVQPRKGRHLLEPARAGNQLG